MLEVVECKRASALDKYYQQCGGDLQTIVAVSPEQNNPRVGLSVSCRPLLVNYEQPHNLPIVHQHSNSEVDRFACTTEVARLDGPTYDAALTGLSCHNETVAMLVN